jgi:hypothetical protein
MFLFNLSAGNFSNNNEVDNYLSIMHLFERDTSRYVDSRLQETVLLHPRACSQHRSAVLTSMNYTDFIFDGKHKKSNLKMFDKFNLTEWASWESDHNRFTAIYLFAFQNKQYN